MIKLLIFDMDDTIINHGHMSYPAWIKTGEKLVADYHLDIDGTLLGKRIGKGSESLYNNEDTRPKVNYSPYEVRYKIIKEALDDLKIELANEYIDYLIKEYDSVKKEMVCVYDDVFTTLASLKEKGYILALLTNGDSKFQREKIKRFDLDPHFDYTFVSGEIGVDKPHRKAYEIVCNKCGVKLNETCMIGDNYLWEAAAPKKYGLTSVWVNRTGYDKEDNQADYTIENIRDLLKYF